MRREDTPRLIVPGETFGMPVRYTHAEIANFARLTLDSNPLHHDLDAARRGGFGVVIASGQHTAATMMGLVATHFSRADDGVARQVLCLNFNFSFKQPVYADQELQLRWRVAQVAWNDKLAGMIGHLDGSAFVAGQKANVIGRGTVLVQHPA
jgi:acyl dehydratase